LKHSGEGCAGVGVAHDVLTEAAGKPSKSVALLPWYLGVSKTHSRRHVSNDNPVSESNFKTLK
jgi:putative transposase